MISLLFAGKYSDLAKFCKVQLANYSLDIVLSSDGWSDMQISYIICIFINTDENFRKKGKL